MEITRVKLNDIDLELIKSKLRVIHSNKGVFTAEVEIDNRVYQLKGRYDYNDNDIMYIGNWFVDYVGIDDYGTDNIETSYTYKAEKQFEEFLNTLINE